MNHSPEADQSSIAVRARGASRAQRRDLAQLSIESGSQDAKGATYLVEGGVGTEDRREVLRDLLRKVRRGLSLCKKLLQLCRWIPQRVGKIGRDHCVRLIAWVACQDGGGWEQFTRRATERGVLARSDASHIPTLCALDVGDLMPAELSHIFRRRLRGEQGCTYFS